MDDVPENDGSAPPGETEPSSGGSRLLLAVRRFLPVLILLVVAGWQMYRVQVDDLSPWKGGGFGMYSTVHFDDYQIWVEWRVPGRPASFVNMSRPATPESRAMALQALLFPNEESLAEFKKTLPLFAGKIEVWRPYLDPETLEYTRELIAEYDE